MQIIEDTKVKLDEYEKRCIDEVHSLDRKIRREANSRDCLFFIADNICYNIELLTKLSTVED